MSKSVKIQKTPSTNKLKSIISQLGTPISSGVNTDFTHLFGHYPLIDNLQYNFNSEVTSHLNSLLNCIIRKVVAGAAEISFLAKRKVTLNDFKLMTRYNTGINSNLISVNISNEIRRRIPIAIRAEFILKETGKSYGDAVRTARLYEIDTDIDDLLGINPPRPTKSVTAQWHVNAVGKIYSYYLHRTKEII